MLANYLITAIRNILRNKTYSFINLTGLTLGLVSSMLIFQYVIFENSADKFHTNVENTYRVNYKRVINNGEPEIISQGYLGSGEAFKAEIPTVERFARIRADFFQEGPTVSHSSGSEKIALKDIRSIIVDSTFLEFFTFPLVRGNRRTALQLPNSIIISESTALRLFGDQDPIGKTLEYSMNQGPQSLQVTGVAKEPPANSHIQFDVMIPLHHYLGNVPETARRRYSDWNFREVTTYVQLDPAGDVKVTERMMTELVHSHVGEQLKEINATIAIQLQPMSSVYLDRKTDLGLIGFGSVIVAARTGNERMVNFLTFIAIITLAISLMSYVNLSTARSLDRAKEVGIRKVVGARRNGLQAQFFMESTLMNVAAVVLAIPAIALLMPAFNSFVQTSFTLESWFNPSFLALFGGVFIASILLSGLYPAFVLSSFRPIVALKGDLGSPLLSKTRLRKFLVVLQYAPAIALLVCTVVVYSQLDFMRNMDVGLEMEKLITIRSPRFLPEGMISRDAEAVFKNELTALSGIAGASFAGNQAGRGLNFLVPFDVDSSGRSGIRFFKGSGIDHDFASVFGLKLLAGEPFTMGMGPLYGNPDDFTRKVLVNETAVKTWGYKRNEDVVGRVVPGIDGSRYYIQGVLEDFNWSSVQKSTDPVLLWYTPANRFMTIKIAGDASFESTLAQVKTIYDRLFPMDVFHYEFADDVYNRQYGEDERFARLFGIFSSIAIFIASLGLFGLSAFAAARRTKEISIRKVMGANVGQLVRLLSREFLLLVLIAFVLASPVAWLIMDQWLQNFAFHIGLTFAPFVVVGVGALLIAMVTVSVRSLRVATINPVDALRNE
jgi:putative ABC transport system permease protein